MSRVQDCTVALVKALREEMSRMEQRIAWLENEDPASGFGPDVHRLSDGSVSPVSAPKRGIPHDGYHIGASAEQRTDGSLGFRIPLPRPTHGDAIAEVRKRGKKGRKRNSSDLMTAMRDALIAHVRKHPGQKAEQVREAIHAEKWHMPRLRVLAGHAVKLKGQKRSATYWPKGGGK